MKAAPFSEDDSLGERQPSEESLEMRIYDPVHNSGWDHLDALHRDAGCFHTSAWAKVLHQTYNHHPLPSVFPRTQVGCADPADGSVFKRAGDTVSRRNRSPFS